MKDIIQWKTEVVGDIYLIFYIIEVIIDSDYDKFIKVPDVLYDCQLPEMKVLPQADNIKTEKKNNMKMNIMKNMFGYA